MLGKRFHLSEHELLLTADRELSPRRLARARTHLSECSACRARMGHIERTLAEATQLSRPDLTIPLPPASASRAQLKARLMELSEPTLPSSVFRVGRWVFACGVLLAAGLGVQLLFDQIAPRPSQGFNDESGVFLLPRVDLTPGMTQPVTVSEVCGAGRYGRTRPIPTALHQRVFQSYGADYRRAAEYELDHLITPELGGSQDVRNLWPQPYSRTPWNAYVKDELELHFHRLVCDGKMDFATAQREMATDWISAYKRHFKTDKPLRDYATRPLTERDKEFLLSELEESGLLFRVSPLLEREVRQSISAPAVASLIPVADGPRFTALADVVFGQKVNVRPPTAVDLRNVRTMPVLLRNDHLASPVDTARVPPHEPDHREPEV